MCLMIRRLILACAIVFGFLSLVRADPGAMQASPSPGNGERGQREHPRFQFKVGHRVMTIDVPSSVAGGLPSVDGRMRKVDVHLWYPADPWDYLHSPETEYTSPLNGIKLVPLLWDPLSWKVASPSAREGPSIFRGAPKYPVVVFSHGNTNAPIDYAFTMEDVASAGFVVAAPTHVNNSQDDVRMDYANAEAENAGFLPPFPFPECLDGARWSKDLPCSHGNVALSMADRARDITYTLDALSAELENRVDLHRVGVFGHSRGTVTALTAAGGSTAWNVLSEPRIKVWNSPSGGSTMADAPDPTRPVSG